MKQYAVIGASAFGKQVLEELILLDCEVILIDKDPVVIDYFKNEVTAAYIADVINKEIISKLIPPDIDAVVVDLGDRIEASILTTQYLRKLGVEKIIVKAETDQHGEILSIIGADHVVFPNLEAAKRVTPLLVSDILFNYLPISDGLVLAETGVPEELVGRTLVELDLRRNRGINVMALRRAYAADKAAQDSEAGPVPGLDPVRGKFEQPPPDYRLSTGDTLLIVAKEGDVLAFAGREQGEHRQGVTALFRQLFNFRHPDPQ